MQRAKDNRGRWWMVVVLLLSGGCYGSGGNSSGEDPSLASPLVTATVAEKFAADFEHAVLIQDRAAIHEFFDWKLILDQATESIDGVGEEAVNSFRAGASHSYQQRGVAAELTGVVAAGGQFKFLRLREKGNRTRALFRLSLPNSAGLNYCELVLVPRPGGTCTAIDFFSFNSGEMLTTAIARVFEATVNDESQALLKSASEADPDLSNLQQILHLFEASEAGNAAKVLEIYADLPDSWRNDRSLRLMYLRAASRDNNDEQFQQAIDSFRAQYPDDIAIDLLFDRLDEKQQYDQALASIDRIDQAVGGDPYLDVKRAGVFVEKRDFAAAWEAANRAIQADPEMEHAYWVALTISLKTREYEDTTELLEKMAERFRLKYADISEMEEYLDFYDSLAYEAWQDRIRKREEERRAKREGRRSRFASTTDPDSPDDGVPDDGLPPNGAGETESDNSTSNKSMSSDATTESAATP